MVVTPNVHIRKENNDNLMSRGTKRRNTESNSNRNIRTSSVVISDGLSLKRNYSSTIPNTRRPPSNKRNVQDKQILSTLSSSSTPCNPHPNSSTSTNLTSLTQISVMPSLSSRNHTSRSRKFNNSPIPMVDLTTKEVHNAEHVNRNGFQGISKEYLDHGDQVIICEVCHAKLWKDEAVLGRRTDIGMCYSMCCGYGKVELPDLMEPPPRYRELFSFSTDKSKCFLKNIRRYKSMFSFTSMGGKIDKSINSGRGPPVFRLSGQNYHSVGSLLPQDGEPPKFSQLYIYDTENEVVNRQQVFKSKGPPHALELEIIEEIKDILDKENVLVKTYRMARDTLLQLYVALSRVKSRDGLKLLILDEDGNVTNQTENVVYKSVFSNL